MKVFKLIWVLWIGVLLLSGQSIAQGSKPPAKAPAKPAPASKPMPDTLKLPQFSARFGPYNGKIEALPDDLKKLVGTELIVTDQRGQKWDVVAFRFIWNRKETNDDWKTGKRTTIISPHIVELDGVSKLPESWQNEVKEYLQSGETLLFERIIVGHPESKRNLLATDLTVKIR